MQILVYWQLLLLLISLFSLTIGYQKSYLSIRRKFRPSSQLFAYTISQDEDAVIPAPDNLRVAKDFAIDSKFGLLNSDILALNFVESKSSYKSFSRESYLSQLASDRSSLLRALPDFDFRPYDFLVDDNDPSVIWFRMRPKGTFTGPLSYKGEVYLPSEKEIEFPITQASVKIVDGKVLIMLTMLTDIDSCMF
jgi:hypothetical protein